MSLWASTASEITPERRAADRLARTARVRLADAFRRRHSLAALALYVAASALIERAAVGHLNSVCACNAGSDPTQFMWAMIWWPRAILHVQNPLVTHLIWTPGGLNLASATSVPAAALLASPITALFGPVVAYNLVMIAAPVLGAWFAYRLCLHLTHAPAASILGGYLFGFSSYELAHMIGLLHTVLTFVVPALTLLTLRRLDGSIGQRRFVVLAALLLILQVGFSTEMLLSLTIVGAFALGAGFALATPDYRRKIVELLPLLAAAYALMAIICSPYLYQEVVHGTNYSAGWDNTYLADATGFLVPTVITLVGGHAFSGVSQAFLGNPTENGSYLGLPLVVIVAAFAIQMWRTRTAKLLVAVIAFAVLWSLGSHLMIDGHQTISLPFSVVSGWPLLDQTAPVRIAVFVALGCSVAAALWLARARSGWVIPWTLAALAVVFLIPNLGATYPGGNIRMFHARLDQPAFFTTDLYRRYLRPGEIVLPLPWGPNGSSLLWQARTDMYFRLASGYFGSTPAEYARDPIVQQLQSGVPRASAPAQLRAFLALHHVSAVVADPQLSGAWLGVLAKLGLRPIQVGGILLYRVAGA